MTSQAGMNRSRVRLRRGWIWLDMIGGRAARRSAVPRWIAASAIGALLLVVFSGCAMCQNPWDYCNAVLGPNGCPNCDFGARCGSAFRPIGHTPPTTELGPTPAGDTSQPADNSDDYSPEPTLDEYDAAEDPLAPAF